MRRSSIVFAIDPEAYITVYLKCALENVFHFDTHRAKITLHHGAIQNLLISPSGWFSFDADVVKTCLQELFAGQQELPVGVSIGHAWEHYRQRESDDNTFYFGPLWSVGGCQGNATFLYTQQGTIFLETFPYWNREGSYEEFLAKLQPIVRIELSRAVVETWLAQAEELLKIIEGNYKRALRKDIRRHQKETAAWGRRFNRRERVIRLVKKPSLKRFLKAAKKN